MKRLTMILALLLMVTMPMMAERVSPETARKVATTFLNNNGAKSSQLTDLSKEAGFDNLYIFNAEQGFVIIAADDCVRPILGYSLTDKFVVNNMPENMREWLQGYSDEIQFAIDSKMSATAETAKMWRDLAEGNSKAGKATAVVNPLLQTTWNQNGIYSYVNEHWIVTCELYNNLCPYDSNAGERTLTGCVATAMAQILKYWGTVSTPGIGSHSYIHETYGLQSADFGNTIYNWGNMPLSLSASSTTEQINEVAKLMYHCGVSVDMDYGLSSYSGGHGSSAYSLDIPSALINYFNYNTNAKHVDRYSDDEAWKTLLKNELEAGRPMAYHGSGSGGHAFVCDGYNSDDYFHFNWGWSGSENDFYTLDDLTPGNHNYNNNQGAVIGIKPATIGQATAPTLEVIAIQEPGVRNAQLTWDGVDNATAYRVYRNNNLIFTTSSGSETSYTDVHIAYGTSTYFVRSVDENGDLSWPSNYASLTLTFSAPTDLEAEKTEDGVALSWLAGENAVSYNVYCNNVRIGSNINTTTYTDSRIIAGTLSYFVKGVDTFGDESEASEAAEITIPYNTPVVNDLSASLSGDDASLTWTAPQWCYPSEPSATLTYGSQVSDGTCMGWGADSPFWGQRHLAERMPNYDGKKLYKVSFSINYPETYELYIYEGSTTLSNDVIIPKTLIASQTIIVTDPGWNTIDLSEPIEIDGTQDLWIFMHNPNSIENFKTHVCSASNTYLYYSYNPSANMDTYPDYAYLIKAYLTDGTYTYNLYDGTTTVASNINATNYTISNVTDDAAHQYTVKTNYYGGESAASNVAGLTLGTASLSSLELGENDKMTVTEGSKLTVSGTLSDINEDNLILENGAELVHNSANVKATVKKTITPPSTDDYGWYFIASPVTETVTPTTDNGFLNGAYDLYYYNEPTYYWMNYEYSPFDINHQKGYLYANETTDGTTLQFAGTLTPSNNSVTINNLSHSASSLNGFNLVGNPFACNATVGEDFYVVNNTTGKVILASNTAEIAPCAGIFVKATENDASVTFAKAASRVEPSSSSFDIVVKREAQPTRDGVSAGSTTLDRARIRLGDAETLEKFSIGDGEGCVIYFPQDGQDLAVACANGENEMPLNFKAAKNGTYMLAFEVENLDLDYLHLIDNMTGNEVDVLAMPTYTFEAKTTDYASRFKLVFAEPTDGPSADDQPFAYYANGEIRIVADACDASLQVVDVTGRVVASVGGHTRCVPTTGMVPGVYVLRLINGDSVRTQKIVIE